MKKLIITCFMLIACFINSMMVCVTAKSNTFSPKLKMGDYIFLGKYKDEPIIWRYSADDDNGKLIVSDKILCYRPYYNDSGIDNITNRMWRDSYIINWLNSSVSSKNADWGLTLRDKQIEKYHIEVNENAIDTAFNSVKIAGGYYGSHFEPNTYYNILEMPEYYYGAAYQTKHILKRQTDKRVCS